MDHNRRGRYGGDLGDDHIGRITDGYEGVVEEVRGVRCGLCF